MGGLPGAPGRRGARGEPLTRWLFRAEDVPAEIDGPVALILAPRAVRALPPPPGGETMPWRSVARRRVLAALAARVVRGPVELVADGGSVRHLAHTPLFASVAERDGWAAAVLSPEPIGIDVESIAEADAATEPFSAGVLAVYGDWHGAAGLWAAREAVLKATGRDLTRDPLGWRFVGSQASADGIPPHHVDFAAPGGFIAAVAYVGG